MTAAASRTLDLSQLARDVESLGVDPASLDHTRALAAVSVYLGGQAKKCFAESRTPDGFPWAPLKRPSRRRGGTSAKPLIDTGLLMASAGGVGSGGVRRLDAASLEQGTALHYAGYHQDGTRTIKARPFLGITDAMAARIETIVADDVVRQLGF